MKAKSFSIIGIKELGFQINENNIFSHKDSLNVNFGFDYQINSKEGTINFGVKVSFTDSEEQKEFFSGKVQTLFKVDVRGKKNKDNRYVIDYDDQMLITMLSLSISHARGILARSVSGTIHQNLIIPVVNPTYLFNEVVKKDLESIGKKLNECSTN